jgi:hypothetical protein
MASPVGEQATIVHRSFPHGHVAAALGALRKIGHDRVLGPVGNRCRDLVMAMVVMRLLPRVLTVRAQRQKAWKSVADGARRSSRRPITPETRSEPI